MSYRGDFALESTFDLKFTTRRFTTGAPFALASGVISAYVDNSLTQLTAGITLTSDFDSVTGLNNVRVVATAANGYAAGSNYHLVITTGTVDSVSVVGEVIGEFSIQARSALRPTVATRTLDVSAGGEAGIDWANIGSPTTAQNLSATNIDVDQVIASVTGAVGSVIDIADAVWDEAIAGHLGAGSTGLALNSASAAGDPWSTALPGAYGAGTAGKIVGDNINATVSSRSSQTSLDTLDDFVDTEVAAIKAKTDLIPASPAAVSNVPTAIENADALLNRDMSIGTDSGSPTVRTPRQALRFLRNKWVIAGTALSVKKEDDTTDSWTGVVSTSPGADPISASDPAG